MHISQRVDLWLPVSLPSLYQSIVQCEHRGGLRRIWNSLSGRGTGGETYPPEIFYSHLDNFLEIFDSRPLTR